MRVDYTNRHRNEMRSKQLEFLHACSVGDERAVLNALNSGAVEITFKHHLNSRTALHWSAVRGHETICLILLDFGFSRDDIDSAGKTPFDLCPTTNGTLREILRPINKRSSSSSTENMVKGECYKSEPSSPNDFVPNYIRHPPFPYIKTSFDNCGPPPGSPTGSTVYSYGRRDSLTKTRFLLLRTSVDQGKETYKRITLAGGSTVERLRLTIERACKGRRVDAVFTLPDRVLIEEDDQIHQFADCQKIDVIFSEESSSPVPLGDSKMSETRQVADLREVRVEGPDEVAEKIEEEPRPLTPAEDLSPYAQTKEPSPPVSLANTDLESNADSAPELITESAYANEDAKLVPLATRISLDSEPSDFEKVDREDAKSDVVTSNPAISGLAAAIQVNTDQPEEHPALAAAASPAPFIVDASPKDAVVAKPIQTPVARKDDFSTWLDENQTLVRNVSTAAAVAGIAGLGYLVYSRKFK
ncbi:unnamed protein product [Caenorhabditis auriculariae]|uniref:ANK_REP_REGION domain-containing protein n=1 Tax=Caenorhabditis auriculariae TaxID=2777116 RepID=A0A8S1HDD6_9PELO|nr:unnamed protein product [Caenorhabditis auriculariae]